MMRRLLSFVAVAAGLGGTILFSVSPLGRTPSYASCFVEVSDASGRPMAGVSIVFHDKSGKVARIIATTEKGSCIASGLLSGVTYGVTASACGYTPLKITASPDANGPMERISFRLEKAYASKAASLAKAGDPSGAICGLAVDALCAPVEGADVILEGGDLREPLHATTGADGIFSFAPLAPAADYRVYATLSGFSTVIRKPVEVKAGEATTMEIQVKPREE